MVPKSNGCTWLPKQPEDVEFCCIKHDEDYINRIGKLKADWNLAKCLWKKQRYLRAIMFPLAVLIPGYYFYYRK